MKNFKEVLSKEGDVQHPLYRIKRGVAKLLEKFIKDNTYGFAIRGHRIKRGVAKLLEKFIKDNTYGFAIRGHRIKRGVAL